MKRILCINPGLTSTKVALYEDENKIQDQNIEHSSEELACYPDIISQLPLRKQSIVSFLANLGLSPRDIDAIAVRGAPGGFPYRVGAYAIDQDLVDKCLKPGKAGHPMILSPVIAYEWVRELQIPAFTYDVVMVDEMKDVARITGLKDIHRRPSCHTLNARAMAMELAEELGKKYEELNLIVCHMGGGISVSVHENGRITDTVSNHEGVFSPSKVGRLGTADVVKLCFSGKYSEAELKSLLGSHGGLSDLLGTTDCREVEARISRGDEEARLVYEALAYNISKDIAMMSVVPDGRVDGIILTGGMAYSEMLVGMISKKISLIAPVTVKPGAKEMEALAKGVLRVLRGEEAYRSVSDNQPKML